MSMMFPEQGGPPEAGPPPSLSSQPDGSNLDALREAIDRLQTYMHGEDDDQNIAKAAKLLAGLQDILAGEQKLTESALNVSPQAKFLARAQGGG